MSTSSLLPSTWNVPQVFRDRLGSHSGRQRTMYADGHLLLILHEPPKPDENERVGCFYWRHPDGTWSSHGVCKGPHALAKHISRYADEAERYHQLEIRATTADEYFAIIDGLAPLHRAARNMHGVLQEARKLVPEDRDMINLRDQAYQVERTLELQYDTAKNSLEFAVAKRAEEQAVAGRYMTTAAHRLNLLVAFFFPIATLTAIFGMNFESGLEGILRPWSFLVVLCFGLISGLVLTRFVTKKPGQ